MIFSKAKIFGLSVLMALGLTACGSDDTEDVRVVEKKVIVQSPGQLQYQLPQLVQSYSIADVEKEYRQCLITYGLDQDDYCEEVCSFQYNAEDCDRVEDYYEDHYGIGATVRRDAFFVAVPVFISTERHSNRKYGTSVNVSPKLKSPPKRVVVKPSKVVSKEYSVNKTTVTKVGSASSPKNTSQFTVSKPGTSTLKSTTVTTVKSSSTAKPKTVVTSVSTTNIKKISGADKFKSQFTVEKPKSSKAVSSSNKAVSSGKSSIPNPKTKSQFSSSKPKSSSSSSYKSKSSSSSYKSKSSSSSSSRKY